MSDTPARPLGQRVRDTRAMLANETDCWVATASGGIPHLVALSFAWHDGEIALATPRRYRTVTNLEESPSVKLSFGTLHDVVIIDGTATVSGLDEVTTEELDRFVLLAGWDPRSSEGNAYIRVRPDRILAWRHESELAGRVMMRDGRWLDDEEGGDA